MQTRKGGAPKGHVKYGGATFQKGNMPWSKGRFRESSPNWKGGRLTNAQGYVLVREPKHPRNQNGYLLEHRFVMEQKLDRYLLPYELVHHVNGIRSDNRPENLMLVTRKKHKGIVLCPHCQNQFLIE